MKVKYLKFEKWISGLTTAEINHMTSYKVYINDICITSNLPELDFEDNLLQIDVCTECFYIGCASGGYVQVLKDKDIIVWKEPLLNTNGDYERSQYTHSYGLKYGTIFWDKELFNTFLKQYNYDESNILFAGNISIDQARDMWRIYGSKCFEPKSIDSYPIDTLERNVLTLYSEGLEDEGCNNLFRKAKTDWNMAKEVSLVRLPEKSQKVIVIFDFEQEFREWDFIHLIGEKILYPIGDGFAFELKF